MRRILNNNKNFGNKGMREKTLFLIIPLILTIGIIPSLPISNADYMDDIYREEDKTQCRVGQVLVFRTTANDYICTDQGAALRWARLGIAEIVSQAAEEAAESSEEVKPEGVFPSTMIYTKQAPEINPEKGYFVAEIADGLYWLIDGGYQMMFLTTGQGVIVVDAPEQMGGKILQAISDVTDEPVTHVIYSHIHKDHIGSAHIYPDDAVYIAHSDTAKHLAMKNDPDRPVPTESFDDTYTLSVGNQVLVLSYEGAFHSKGDIVILASKQKVAMVVDLFHPDAGPFLGFGITTDMNAHLAIHDTLLEEYDFDVLVPAHEQILATKDHLKTNKQFALDVMANVIQAQQMVDYMEFVQQYSSQGRYAVYANYFDAVTQKCAELTLEEWQGKLKELEPFMEDHCRVMSFYVSID